jgi:hypothetical protein
MGSSPRTRFGSDSRQYGKRFPGCLDAKRKTIAYKAVVFFYADSAPYLNCHQNRKEYPMSTTATSVIRKYWKPALITGAGGTSLILWFEEIILFGLDILAILSVLVVTGPILLFNHFVFKEAMPTLKDKNK